MDFNQDLRVSVGIVLSVGDEIEAWYEGRLSHRGPVESQRLVNARGSTVCDILTDSGNLTVWDSGITTVSGEIRDGAIIRICTRHGGDHNFRVRVEQIPGEVMT